MEKLGGDDPLCRNVADKLVQTTRHSLSRIRVTCFPNSRKFTGEPKALALMPFFSLYDPLNAVRHNDIVSTLSVSTEGLSDNALEVHAS